MSKVLENALLRKLYGDIIRGVSRGIILGRTCYIKHLCPIDQADVENRFLQAFQEAVSGGLPDDSQRLALTDKDGTWTATNEQNLNEKEAWIKALFKTKATLDIAEQIASVTKDIDTASFELFEMRYNREACLGLTAEQYAEKKLGEIQVFNSLFRDLKCSVPLFSTSEFEELDEIEFNTIVKDYNTSLAEMNIDNIRRIANSVFFLEYFNLCEGENYAAFFGKSIAMLTYLQVQVLSYGRIFKIIHSSEHQIPSDINDKPDKILEWFATVRNSGSRSNRNSSGPNLPVEEAVKEMGSVVRVESDGTVVKKLSMDDLIALQ